MATAVRLCDRATPRPDCLTTRPIPGHDQGHRQWKCRAHRRHGHAQTNTTKNQHTEISRNPQSDKARWIRAETRSGIEQDLALGQLIYDLRTEAGLSQRELAARMGTTQSVISRLEEGGGARNRIDTLARVATALDRHLVVSFPEELPDQMKDAVQVA